MVLSHTWRPLVCSHQKGRVIPVVTLWVRYLPWYVIVWGENERKEGARLVPCCFKWSNTDPLEVAQLLAKEGTLWAIKAIKEVLQSNPCRQVISRKEKKVSSPHNESRWLLWSCGCRLRQLKTPFSSAEVKVSPALCSRVVLVVYMLLSGQTWAHMYCKRGTATATILLSFLSSCCKGL